MHKYTELASVIVRLLAENNPKSNRENSDVRVVHYSEKSITLEFTSYITLNFNFLLNLSNYFGTTNIVTDSRYERGCETCGGDMIKEVSIQDITKNNPTL